MRFRVAILSTFALVLSFLIGCGGGSPAGVPTAPTQLPSNDPLGTTEMASLYLTSTNLLDVEAFNNQLVMSFLNQEVGEDVDESENCHVESNGIGLDGQCVKPINVTGTASAVSIGSMSGNGEPPARLFGATQGLSLGRNGQIEVFSYDFANPTLLQGVTNLEDTEDKNTEWDLASVHMGHMDVQMRLKNEFWTVRFAFISANPTDEPEIQSCGIDEYYLSSIEENGTISDVPFRKGDVMLCTKSSAGSECEDDDFLWYDLDEEEFTDTRPENPMQHGWADVEDVSCDSEGENQGYEVSLGGYDLVATIDTPFELSAELNGCERVFTYTDPDTNEESEGNTLSATFDYDTEDFIFIDTLDDLEELSDAELLESMSLQQIWVRLQQDDPGGTGSDQTGLTVDIDIEISNDDDFTCEDSEDIDSSLLTGTDCTPDGYIRASCEHEACSGFEEISGTIWSVSGEGDNAQYCTRQTCEDEYNGETRMIYCESNE